LAYAEEDYYRMAKDAARMVGVQPENPLGYSLSAIAQRELGQFDAAIEDHDRAIDLSPDDVGLYNERRQTHMHVGNYTQALTDARKCAELGPKTSIYQYHAFCAFVAEGRYDDARAVYEAALKSDLERTTRNFMIWAHRYVAEALDAGLQWRPPGDVPNNIVFVAMLEAEESYQRLAEKATRVANEGTMPRWSADGTKLAYNRGFTGSSAIAILDVKSGKSRLLVTPGKNPAWSPDGDYIAYVRDRRVLPFDYLTGQRASANRSSRQEEIWLVRTDGTEEPHFLVKGGSPCWSQDSKRVFYHFRAEKELRVISVAAGSEPVSVVSCSALRPALSPDETHLLYRWGGGLAIAELSSGKIVRNIIPNLVWAPMPNWSPDGRQVILPDFTQSFPIFGTVYP
jgi:hypothetical protein